MKKNYYTPEVRFYQLRSTASMLAGSSQEESKQGENDEELSKGFGSFYFDEDED